MNFDEIVQGIEHSGVVAIVRSKKDRYTELTEAMAGLAATGLRAVEITMNTPRAKELLAWAKANLPAQMILGAGTVTSVDEVKAAIDSGAQFLVSPILSMEVIAESLRQNVPIAPGCYTPTEAFTAHRAGAPFVKIFPCESPDYIKALLAPLPMIKLMPTGGINEKNCGEFIRAGSTAVGIGSAIFSDALLAKKDYRSIAYQAGLIVKAVATAKEVARSNG